MKSIAARAALPTPPPMRLSSIALVAGLTALVVASFATLPLDGMQFFSADAIASMSEFIHGFAPPEMAPRFLRKVAMATMETLSMSALGTAIAAMLGTALALPASGRFGKMLRLPTRMLLNFLRSIPELVWASVLVIAAGLGPFAGTLALAAHTTGVLGRLFADAMENVPPLAESTLRTNGAKPLAVFLYATLPQAAPQMMSYTLYRWENNIRAAAILGVVGAGGLGQMLKYFLSLFQMQQAATVIIAMLLLVALVDAISFWLRRVMTD
ncbi:MAG TPA: phosphonate ABC transporter, permease protein PhnE [Burkholderiaceae bacterium]|jgi:phosphonate transport system permease protein